MIKTKEEKLQELKNKVKELNSNIEILDIFSENKKSFVKIFCKKCNEELVTRLDNFKLSYKCPKCNNKNKGRRCTTEEFIQKAIKIHGDKYDYSKVNYINNITPVTIICKKHGEFDQIPTVHICQKSGCPKCGKEITQEEWIQKAKEVHGNKYDYSKVNYISSLDKVEIICPIHGSFWQVANSHTSTKCGCPKCSLSKGEAIIEQWLKTNNINYISQYEIEIDINSSGKGKVDFYLPDLNIIIEYNGLQHYIPIKYFGGEVGLERLKMRDTCVKDYCNIHNIELLEIPFTRKSEQIKLKLYDALVL